MLTPLFVNSLRHPGTHVYISALFVVSWLHPFSKTASLIVNLCTGSLHGTVYR